MKKTNNHSHSKAKQVALSGLMGAMMITIMLVGSVLPFSTYCAPAFAGICLIPVVVEYGYKASFVLYSGISGLCLFFLIQKEMALFFVCLFGYYPIVKVWIQKINCKIIRFFIKLIIVNVSLFVIYFILLFVFTTADARQTLLQSGWRIILIYFTLCNITFFLYDVLIDRASVIYICKIRKYFF